MRDYYGKVAYTVKDVDPMDQLKFKAVYHRFTSDGLVRHYGDEIDLFASAKFNENASFKLRYADYWANTF